MSRRVARELAFKIIFQVDMGNNDPEFALETTLESENLSPRDRDFVCQVVRGCLKEKEYIDSCISRYLVKWNLERLSGVDRSMLRLAVYEIKFREDIPPAVSINEAVELVKTYQGEKSASFINSVLDNMSREEQTEK